MRELSLSEIDMVAGGDSSSYYDAYPNFGPDGGYGGGGVQGDGGSTTDPNGSSSTTPTASTASAISELQQFMDSVNQSPQYSGGSAGDSSSDYDQWENYAPYDQEFLSEWGWLPTVQNDPASHYYDYLTQDVDAEFLMESNAGGITTTINGHNISLTAGTAANNAIVNDNGAIFLIQEHNSDSNGSTPNDGSIAVIGKTYDAILLGNANSNNTSINYNDHAIQLAALHQYTSGSGHNFSTMLNLNGTQITAAGKIVDYGISHNYTMSEITIAVNQAYYESSLGTLLQNPTSSATGLFQYKPDTWNESFPNLNINSVNDQISAMFMDIKKFEGEYKSEINDGTLNQSYTLNSYVELRHHLGDFSKQYNSPVITEYNLRTSSLNFSIDGRSWSTAA